jgi:GTPase SAR1 family protein
MTFFDELESLETEESALMTDLATSGHPVFVLTEDKKSNYLSLVALVGQADEETHPAESAMLRDLASAIGLSGSQIEEAEAFARRRDDAHLNRLISDWQNHPNRHLLFLDMCRISSVDDKIHKREEFSLERLGEHLGVNQSQRKALLSFSRGLRSAANITQRDRLSSLTATEIPTEQFHFLMPTETQDTAVASSEEPQPEPLHQPSAPKSLPHQAIMQAQRDAISHMAALMKTIARCRPTGEGTFALGSNDQLDAYLAQVQGELSKVEQLRFTLAVIGPMKAGKSTLINSIVGDDILPTRFGAMTTLPTLVTHRNGQQTPVLRFKNPQPFNALIAEIHAKASGHGGDEGHALEENEDFWHTIERIRSGELRELTGECVGTDAIHTFLQDLNDLVRISQHSTFQMQSPLEHCVQIEDFPEIEVEFTYFKNRAPETVGKLTIIDTPGPDEAGQGHLKGIVKGQLSSASAILVVASAGQFDNEAFHELNSWLHDARVRDETPLYVFCTRFDQLSLEDRKAGKIERKCLARMPDVKTDSGSVHTICDRVFGVSASRALLANRAMRSLETTGVLPDHNAPGNSWVLDFAQEAYGTESAANKALAAGHVVEHKCRCEELWQHSRMEKPLRDVVEVSMNRAAPLCLKRAVDKIGALGQRLQQNARGTRNSIEKSIDLLKGSVKKMHTRLLEIERVEKEMYPLQIAAVTRVSDALTLSLKEMKDEVIAVMANLSKAEGDKVRQAEEQQSKENRGFLYTLERLLRRPQKSCLTQVFASDDPISFQSKTDAEAFIKKLRSEVGKTIDSSLQEAANRLEPIVSDCQKNLAATMNDKLGELLVDFGEEIRRDFDIQLEPPVPELPRIRLDLDIIQLGKIKEQNETRSFEERRWYTLGLVKHSVEYQHTEFKVEPRQLRHDLEQELAAEIDRMGSSIKEFLSGTFAEMMEVYFSGLGDKIGEVKSIAESGIETKKMDEKAQLEAKRVLRRTEDDLKDWSEALAQTAGTLAPVEA